LSIEATAAAWFAPFVLPVCLYVAFTDLREMRITNQAVGALVVIFAIGGALLFPLPDYLWRWLHLVVVLAVGVAITLAGGMGAGDAKFLAAAAPYVALQDLSLVFYILAATSLAGVLVHRIAKHTPLRRLTPHWQSWTETRRFPFGFPLGTALAAYLVLTALAG
jgi:prepilin peptidase CpaA